MPKFEVTLKNGEKTEVHAPTQKAAEKHALSAQRGDVKSAVASSKKLKD